MIAAVKVMLFAYPVENCVGRRYCVLLRSSYCSLRQEDIVDLLIYKYSVYIGLFENKIKLMNFQKHILYIEKDFNNY